MKLGQRLSYAGKELLKANIGNALKSLSAYHITLNPSDYRGGASTWFFGPDGTPLHFSFQNHQSALKAYLKCPPIPAIINRKAQAFINGKTWLLNAKNKEAEGQYANKLKKLMERPNPLQSWKQFEAQGYIYQQLFGYNIILPIKPVGFNNVLDATAIWNIPPILVDVQESQKIFYQTNLAGMVDTIRLAYKGETSALKLEDICIMKDITPSFDTLIFPESRIRALEMPINNTIGAYESRNVLINNRGALGILTNQTKDSASFIPLKESDKQEIQKDFARYGLRKNQWQFVITSADLKWQSMSYPTKDLMLFEEIEDGIMRMCDSYNYPYYMISSSKGTTFANLNDAKKLLYQDAIIPEAESIAEQWTEFFQTKKYGFRIEKDYSHIPALQEDKVQQATARKTMDEALKLEWDAGLITLNQWLEALGQDPIKDGDVRSTDAKKANVPLAVIIGVGGVQSLISLLTAPGMSAAARQASVEIVFGLAPADAARMVEEDTSSTNDPGTGQTGLQL